MGWERFPHGTDVGVRGIGATKSRAFEEAARALSAVMVGPGRIAPGTMVEIRCEAPGAYKDVSAVVNAALRAQLARKVARLEPVVCIKG